MCIRDSVRVDRAPAHESLLERERDVRPRARRLERAPRHAHDLRPDPVSRQDRHVVPLRRVHRDASRASASRRVARASRASSVARRRRRARGFRRDARRRHRRRRPSRVRRGRRSRSERVRARVRVGARDAARSRVARVARGRRSARANGVADSRVFRVEDRSALRYLSPFGAYSGWVDLCIETLERRRAAGRDRSPPRARRDTRRRRDDGRWRCARDSRAMRCVARAAR